MQYFLFDKMISQFSTVCYQKRCYWCRSCVDRDSSLCWLQKDGDSHLIETKSLTEEYGCVICVNMLLWYFRGNSPR